MDINIFLLCYNESVLLPHTIKHYKKYLPSCKITIYDNESDDNSVEIAKSLGCSVVSWNSNNINDELKKKHLKNNSWKDIKSGWIIMADMDEYLCVTESELFEEMNKGTTILNICGKEMIGESTTFNLSDIDLQNIKKYTDNPYESKKLCFLREKIIDMNYTVGAHNCTPVGEIKYSDKIYFNKHMNYLGLDFLINKITKSYERSEAMRAKGMNYHYTNDIEKIKNNYIKKLEDSKIF